MEDFDNFYNDIGNDIFVMQLQKRYIRDVKNLFEYYSNEEFRKRFRFKKVTRYFAADNSTISVFIGFFCSSFHKPSLIKQKA